MTDERIFELAGLNLGYDRTVRPLDFARAIEREVQAERTTPAEPTEAMLKKLVDTYFNNNCGENLFNRMAEARALLAASIGA